MRDCKYQRRIRQEKQAMTKKKVLGNTKGNAELTIIGLNVGVFVEP